MRGLAGSSLGGQFVHDGSKSCRRRRLDRGLGHGSRARRAGGLCCRLFPAVSVARSARPCSPRAPASCSRAGTRRASPLPPRNGHREAAATEFLRYRAIWRTAALPPALSNARCSDLAGSTISLGTSEPAEDNPGGNPPDGGLDPSVRTQFLRVRAAHRSRDSAPDGKCGWRHDPSCRIDHGYSRQPRRRCPTRRPRRPS